MYTVIDSLQHVTWESMARVADYVAPVVIVRGHVILSLAVSTALLDGRVNNAQLIKTSVQPLPLPVAPTQRYSVWKVNFTNFISHS